MPRHLRRKSSGSGVSLLGAAAVKKFGLTPITTPASEDSPEAINVATINVLFAAVTACLQAPIRDVLSLHDRKVASQARTEEILARQKRGRVGLQERAISQIKRFVRQTGEDFAWIDAEHEEIRQAEAMNEQYTQTVIELCVEGFRSKFEETHFEQYADPTLLASRKFLSALYLGRHLLIEENYTEALAQIQREESAGYSRYLQVGYELDASSWQFITTLSQRTGGRGAEVSIIGGLGGLVNKVRVFIDGDEPINPANRARLIAQLREDLGLPEQQEETTSDLWARVRARAVNIASQVKQAVGVVINPIDDLMLELDNLLDDGKLDAALAEIRARARENRLAFEQKWANYQHDLKRKFIASVIQEFDDESFQRKSKVEQAIIARKFLNRITILTTKRETIDSSLFQKGRSLEDYCNRAKTVIYEYLHVVLTRDEKNALDIEVAEACHAPRLSRTQAKKRLVERYREEYQAAQREIGRREGEARAADKSLEDFAISRSEERSRVAALKLRYVIDALDRPRKQKVQFYNRELSLNRKIVFDNIINELIKEHTRSRNKESVERKISLLLRLYQDHFGEIYSSSVEAQALLVRIQENDQRNGINELTEAEKQEAFAYLYQWSVDSERRQRCEALITKVIELWREAGDETRAQLARQIKCLYQLYQQTFYVAPEFIPPALSIKQSMQSFVDNVNRVIRTIDSRKDAGVIEYEDQERALIEWAQALQGTPKLTSELEIVTDEFHQLSSSFWKDLRNGLDRQYVGSAINKVREFVENRQLTPEQLLLIKIAYSRIQYYLQVYADLPWDYYELKIKLARHLSAGDENKPYGLTAEQQEAEGSYQAQIAQVQAELLERETTYLSSLESDNLELPMQVTAVVASAHLLFDEYVSDVETSEDEAYSAGVREQVADRKAVAIKQKQALVANILSILEAHGGRKVPSIEYLAIVSEITRILRLVDDNVELADKLQRLINIELLDENFTDDFFVAFHNQVVSAIKMLVVKIQNSKDEQLLGQVKMLLKQPARKQTGEEAAEKVEVVDEVDYENLEAKLIQKAARLVASIKQKRDTKSHLVPAPLYVIDPADRCKAKLLAIPTINVGMDDIYVYPPDFDDVEYSQHLRGANLIESLSTGDLRKIQERAAAVEKTIPQSPVQLFVQFVLMNGDDVQCGRLAEIYSGSDLPIKLFYCTEGKFLWPNQISAEFLLALNRLTSATDSVSKQTFIKFAQEASGLFVLLNYRVAGITKLQEQLRKAHGGWAMADMLADPEIFASLEADRALDAINSELRSLPEKYKYGSWTANATVAKALVDSMLPVINGVVQTTQSSLTELANNLLARLVAEIADREHFNMPLSMFKQVTTFIKKYAEVDEELLTQVDPINIFKSELSNNIAKYLNNARLDIVELIKLKDFCLRYIEEKEQRDALEYLYNLLHSPNQSGPWNQASAFIQWLNGAIETELNENYLKLIGFAKTVCGGKEGLARQWLREFAQKCLIKAERSQIFNPLLKSLISNETYQQLIQNDRARAVSVISVFKRIFKLENPIELDYINNHNVLCRIEINGIFIEIKSLDEINRQLLWLLNQSEEVGEYKDELSAAVKHFIQNYNYEKSFSLDYIFYIQSISDQNITVTIDGQAVNPLHFIAAKRLRWLFDNSNNFFPLHPEQARECSIYNQAGGFDSKLFNQDEALFAYVRRRGQEGFKQLMQDFLRPQVTAMSALGETFDPNNYPKYKTILYLVSEYGDLPLKEAISKLEVIAILRKIEQQADIETLIQSCIKNIKLLISSELVSSLWNLTLKPKLQEIANTKKDQFGKYYRFCCDIIADSDSPNESQELLIQYLSFRLVNLSATSLKNEIKHIFDKNELTSDSATILHDWLAGQLKRTDIEAQQNKLHDLVYSFGSLQQLNVLITKELNTVFDNIFSIDFDVIDKFSKILSDLLFFDSRRINTFIVYIQNWLNEKKDFVTEEMNLGFCYRVAIKWGTPAQRQDFLKKWLRFQLPVLDSSSLKSLLEEDFTKEEQLSVLSDLLSDPSPVANKNLLTDYIAELSGNESDSVTASIDSPVLEQRESSAFDKAALALVREWVERPERYTDLRAFIVGRKGAEGSSRPNDWLSTADAKRIRLEYVRTMLARSVSFTVATRFNPQDTMRWNPNLQLVLHDSDSEHVTVEMRTLFIHWLLDRLRNPNMAEAQALAAPEQNAINESILAILIDSDKIVNFDQFVEYFGIGNLCEILDTYGLFIMHVPRLQDQNLRKLFGKIANLNKGSDSVSSFKSQTYLESQLQNIDRELAELNSYWFWTRWTRRISQRIRRLNEDRRAVLNLLGRSEGGAEVSAEATSANEKRLQRIADVRKLVLSFEKFELTRKVMTEEVTTESEVKPIKKRQVVKNSVDEYLSLMSAFDCLDEAEKLLLTKQPTGAFDIARQRGITEKLSALLNPFVSIEFDNPLFTERLYEFAQQLIKIRALPQWFDPIREKLRQVVAKLSDQIQVKGKTVPHQTKLRIQALLDNQAKAAIDKINVFADKFLNVEIKGDENAIIRRMSVSVEALIDSMIELSRDNLELIIKQLPPEEKMALHQKLLRVISALPKEDSLLVDSFQLLADILSPAARPDPNIKETKNLLDQWDNRQQGVKYDLYLYAKIFKYCNVDPNTAVAREEFERNFNLAEIITTRIFKEKATEQPKYFSVWRNPFLINKLFKSNAVFIIEAFLQGGLISQQELVEHYAEQWVLKKLDAYALTEETANELATAKYALSKLTASALKIEEVEEPVPTLQDLEEEADEDEEEIAEDYEFAAAGAVDRDEVRISEELKQLLKTLIIPSGQTAENWGNVEGITPETNLENASAIALTIILRQQGLQSHITVRQLKALLTSGQTNGLEEIDLNDPLLTEMLTNYFSIIRNCIVAIKATYPDLNLVSFARSSADIDPAYHQLLVYFSQVFAGNKNFGELNIASIAENLRTIDSASSRQLGGIVAADARAATNLLAACEAFRADEESHPASPGRVYLSDIDINLILGKFLKNAESLADFSEIARDGRKIIISSAVGADAGVHHTFTDRVKSILQSFAQNSTVDPQYEVYIPVVVHNNHWIRVKLTVKDKTVKVNIWDSGNFYPVDDAQIIKIINDTMHEVHPAWSVTEATLRNERLQTDGHTCGDWVIYKLIQEIGSIATFADGVDVARINLANIAQGEVVKRRQAIARLSYILRGNVLPQDLDTMCEFAATPVISDRSKETALFIRREGPLSSVLTANETDKIRILSRAKTKPKLKIRKRAINPVWEKINPSLLSLVRFGLASKKPLISLKELIELLPDSWGEGINIGDTKRLLLTAIEDSELPTKLQTSYDVIILQCEGMSRGFSDISKWCQLVNTLNRLDYKTLAQWLDQLRVDKLKDVLMAIVGNIDLISTQDMPEIVFIKDYVISLHNIFKHAASNHPMDPIIEEQIKVWTLARQRFAFQQQIEQYLQNVKNKDKDKVQLEQMLVQIFSFNVAELPFLKQHVVYWQNRINELLAQDVVPLELIEKFISKGFATTAQIKRFNDIKTANKFAEKLFELFEKFNDNDFSASRELIDQLRDGFAEDHAFKVKITAVLHNMDASHKEKYLVLFTAWQSKLVDQFKILQKRVKDKTKAISFDTTKKGFRAFADEGSVELYTSVDRAFWRFFTILAPEEDKTNFAKIATKSLAVLRIRLITINDWLDEKPSKQPPFFTSECIKRDLAFIKEAVLIVQNFGSPLEKEELSERFDLAYRRYLKHVIKAENPDWAFCIRLERLLKLDSRYAEKIKNLKEMRGQSSGVTAALKKQEYKNRCLAELIMLSPFLELISQYWSLRDSMAVTIQKLAECAGFTTEDLKEIMAFRDYMVAHNKFAFSELKESDLPEHLREKFRQYSGIQRSALVATLEISAQLIIFGRSSNDFTELVENITKLQATFAKYKEALDTLIEIAQLRNFLERLKKLPAEHAIEVLGFNVDQINAWLSVIDSMKTELFALDCTVSFDIYNSFKGRLRALQTEIHLKYENNAQVIREASTLFNTFTTEQQGEIIGEVAEGDRQRAIHSIIEAALTKLSEVKSSADKEFEDDLFNIEALGILHRYSSEYKQLSQIQAESAVELSSLEREVQLRVNYALRLAKENPEFSITELCNIKSVVRQLETAGIRHLHLPSEVEIIKPLVSAGKRFYEILISVLDRLNSGASSTIDDLVLPSELIDRPIILSAEQYNHLMAAKASLLANASISHNEMLRPLIARLSDLCGAATTLDIYLENRSVTNIKGVSELNKELKRQRLLALWEQIVSAVENDDPSLQSDIFSSMQVEAIVNAYKESFGEEDDAESMDSKSVGTGDEEVVAGEVERSPLYLLIQDQLTTKIFPKLLKRTEEDSEAWGIAVEEFISNLPAVIISVTDMIRIKNSLLSSFNKSAAERIRVFNTHALFLIDKDLKQPVVASLFSPLQLLSTVSYRRINLFSTIRGIIHSLTPSLDKQIVAKYKELATSYSGQLIRKVDVLKVSSLQSLLDFVISLGNESKPYDAILWLVREYRSKSSRETFVKAIQERAQGFIQLFKDLTANQEITLSDLFTRLGYVGKKPSGASSGRTRLGYNFTRADIDLLSTLPIFKKYLDDQRYVVLSKEFFSPSELNSKLRDLEFEHFLKALNIDEVNYAGVEVDKSLAEISLKNFLKIVLGYSSIECAEIFSNEELEGSFSVISLQNLLEKLGYDKVRLTELSVQEHLADRLGELTLMQLIEALSCCRQSFIFTASTLKAKLTKVKAFLHRLSPAIESVARLPLSLKIYHEEERHQVDDKLMANLCRIEDILSVKIDDKYSDADKEQQIQELIGLSSELLASGDSFHKLQLIQQILGRSLSEELFVFDMYEVIKDFKRGLNLNPEDYEPETPAEIDGAVKRRRYLPESASGTFSYWIGEELQKLFLLSDREKMLSQYDTFIAAIKESPKYEDMTQYPNFLMQAERVRRLLISRHLIKGLVSGLSQLSDHLLEKAYLEYALQPGRAARNIQQALRLKDYAEAKAKADHQMKIKAMEDIYKVLAAEMKKEKNEIMARQQVLLDSATLAKQQLEERHAKIKADDEAEIGSLNQQIASIELLISRLPVQLTTEAERAAEQLLLSKMSATERAAYQDSQDERARLQKYLNAFKQRKEMAAGRILNSQKLIDAKSAEIASLTAAIAAVEQQILTEMETYRVQTDAAMKQLAAELAENLRIVADQYAEFETGRAADDNIFNIRVKEHKEALQQCLIVLQERGSQEDKLWLKDRLFYWHIWTDNAISIMIENLKNTETESDRCVIDNIIAQEKRFTDYKVTHCEDDEQAEIWRKNEQERINEKIADSFALRARCYGATVQDEIECAVRVLIERYSGESEKIISPGGMASAVSGEPSARRDAAGRQLSRQVSVLDTHQLTGLQHAAGMTREATLSVLLSRDEDTAGQANRFAGLAGFSHLPVGSCFAMNTYMQGRFGGIRAAAIAEEEVATLPGTAARTSRTLARTRFETGFLARALQEDAVADREVEPAPAPISPSRFRPGGRSQ